MSVATSSREKIDDDVAALTLDQIYEADPKNALCFDCCAPEPSWCSLNLAVWVCAACSGHHRSFGTHISRVKSATLDSWTEKELKQMRFGGNSQLDEILQRYQMPNGYTVHELYHTVIADWYRGYMDQVVNA